MQYSPKLKKAMEEIKSILAKHDIGGVVILHTPNHSEYLCKLNPSYSCIVQTGDQIRFRSKLADYNGDKKAWQQKTTDSLNLLKCVTEVGGHVVLSLMPITDELTKKLGDDSGPGEFTSHTSQNN